MATITDATSTQLVTRIEGDSNFYKALSCIPIVGVFVSLFQEISLAQKIFKETDTPKLIELINVKNDYKIAGAVRNLLNAALIVAGVALNVIGSAAMIAAGLHVAFAGWNFHAIRHNSQVIQELKESGFKPGGAVVM